MKQVFTFLLVGICITLYAWIRKY